MLHSTRGGSSETELNELTVMPTGRPSGARAVITVTPVTNRPRQRRKARVSTGSGCGGGPLAGSAFIDGHSTILAAPDTKASLGSRPDTRPARAGMLEDGGRWGERSSLSMVPFALFAGDRGPPVVFLHGIGGQPELFRPQMAAFGGAHRCIAWEMPGYGRTTLPAET